MAENLPVPKLESCPQSKDNYRGKKSTSTWEEERFPRNPNNPQFFSIWGKEAGLWSDFLELCISIPLTSQSKPGRTCLMLSTNLLHLQHPFHMKPVTGSISSPKHLTNRSVRWNHSTSRSLIHPLLMWQQLQHARSRISQFSTCMWWWPLGIQIWYWSESLCVCVCAFLCMCVCSIFCF